MLDFIIKYWLEVLFGLIVAGLAFFARYYYKLWKESQAAQKEKMQEEIQKKIQDEYQKKLDDMQTIIDRLSIVVLTVQGKQFKNDCREILNSGTNINYETFDNLHTEYEIYTSLGGNGLGEKLFELVEGRYSAQLMGKDLSNNYTPKHQATQEEQKKLPLTYYYPYDCKCFRDIKNLEVQNQIPAGQQKK